MFNQKEWSREYRKNNKEKIKEYLKKWRENNPKYNKQYYQNNIEKERERSLQWKKNNPEKVKERVKRYRENNYEKILKHDREYHRENKERDKRNHKEWLKTNPDYMKEWHKQNYKKNKEKIRSQYDQEYHNRYKRIKRADNPKFRLDEKVGWIIWRGLKRKVTGRSWSKFLSYTREELAKHLEKQFKPEMNWDNYGSYWEVDHIIPVCAFNYTKPEDIDFKKCHALKNLQPLTKEENLEKGSKYE